jgi:hypothetical protein
MEDVKTLWRPGMCCLLLAACTPVAAGRGTLEVQLSGGNGVEATWPASEFQDGWQLTLTQLLVGLEDLTVTSRADPSIIGRDGHSVLVDLVKTGPHLWASLPVTQGQYDGTAFSVRPVTTETVLLNTTAQDLQVMVAGGYSMLAVGRLTHGSTVKTFSWGFQSKSRYSGCPLSLKVVANATTTTRFTLHGEQLFLESLSAGATPRFRAQSQADADDNGDGVISVQELSAVDGGANPGSLTFIRNLLQYEEQALARSMRMPGELGCASISVDSPNFKDGGT